ncbi:MAG: GxxExxY protein [Caldilineales bacterium]|nr:GxxExxY protein [Caldilineales bacterium]
MPEEKVLLLHEETTGLVLKAFYHVYNALGYGFSEHVYENAMVIALRKLGLKVEQQKEITVYYEGEAVGFFKADLLVSNLVVVELKAAKALDDEHEAQLLNYLKATTYEVGQLLNFGPKPERVRRAYSNINKGSLSWTHP